MWTFKDTTILFDMSSVMVRPTFVSSKYGKNHKYKTAAFIGLRFG